MNPAIDSLWLGGILGVILGLAAGYALGWEAKSFDMRAKIEAMQCTRTPPTENKTLGGASMAARNGTARVGSTERIGK